MVRAIVHRRHEVVKHLPGTPLASRIADVSLHRSLRLLASRHIPLNGVGILERKNCTPT